MSHEHHSSPAGLHETHTVVDFEHALVSHDSWFRHDSNEPTHQSAHGETKAWGIVAFMAGTLVFVVVVSYLAYFYYEGLTRDRLVSFQEAQTPSAEQISMRAEWSARLSKYEWADAQTGTVRIPLDAAKKRVIQLYASTPQGGVR